MARSETAWLRMGSIDLEHGYNLGPFIMCDVLIILLNIMVILVALLSGKYRTSTKYLLIINLAVADLLMGAIILPFYADYGASEGDWRYPCDLTNTLRLLQINLLPSIATLCVFVINLDFVLRMACYNYTKGKAMCVLSSSLLLIPWLVSAALLIPFYFFATTRGLPYDDHPCVRRYKEDVTGLLHVFFSFFPQCFGIMVSGIAAVVGYLIKRRSTGLDMFGERMHSPVDISMISFLTILFYTPYFCLAVPVNRISCTTPSECDALWTIGNIASWMFVSKSFITPLCWFCCKDFRAAFRKIYCCCYC